MKLSRALFTTKLIFLLVILLRVPTVFGQGHESVAGHQTKHDYHQNLVSFLVGVTGESRHEYGITLGIGYERRVSDAFGVGILAERTSGDFDFWVYAAPVAYHTGHWKFLLAPGVEDGDHGTEFLFRLGTEYAIDVGDGWEIVPQLSIDFVDGEELGLIAVSFAKGF